MRRNYILFLRQNDRIDETHNGLISTIFHFFSAKLNVKHASMREY